MLQTFVKLGIGQNAGTEHALEKSHQPQHNDKHHHRNQDRAQRNVEATHLNSDKGLPGNINQIHPGNVGKDHDRDRHRNDDHHHINRHPQPEIKRAVHRIGTCTVITGFGGDKIGMHQRTGITAQQPVRRQKRACHHQVFEDKTRKRHIAEHHQKRQGNRNHF